MPFPVPDLKPEPFRAPPAIIRSNKREDVLWNRYVFTAPPLVLHPPSFSPFQVSDDEVPRRIADPV